MSQTKNGIRTETKKSAIKLDKISKGEFQKEGTLTAQIRQEVLTKSFYPSKRIDSNLQANIFGSDDFGFEDQVFDSNEIRVAWIPVPENATIEGVQAKLDAASAKGACIYRVLANVPILDDNQKYAITQGLRTMDDFANTQVLRYPKDHDTNPEGLILDKEGNVQYRRTFFWLSAQDDVDVRGQEVPYLSAEIKAELSGASVMQGQTV